MELLDQATLVGLKTYMWNEELAHNNVPTNHALFVIRRAEDKFVRRVLPFRVQELALISILSSLLLFERRLVMELAEEIELLLISSFRFTLYPAHSPRTPRLVVVADISYTDHVVSWRLQPSAPPEEIAGVGMQQPPHSEDATDMCNGEMIEILTKLRLLYCPAMTYGLLEPWNPAEPQVLTEQKLKLEIGLHKEAEQPSDCAICFETLVAGERVLKTGCGHVFHKTCSIPWFGANFTCPMCRSDTLTVL